jgi:hypothetical protein
VCLLGRKELEMQNICQAFQKEFNIISSSFHILTFQKALKIEHLMSTFVYRYSHATGFFYKPGPLAKKAASLIK